MIEKLESINQNEFTYDNHESDWWTSLGLTFTESIDIKKFIEAINKYAVGYCNGENLKIKPKTNSYAVMFKVNDDKFWFHIDKTENRMFKDFLERLK